ncbi:hypothetical protein FRC11_011313, partial [Ceratobasidium sp. 423]
SVRPSQHPRNSFASSGLLDEPVHFASSADDEDFYRNLLGEHHIALPPPLYRDKRAHMPLGPGGYYEPSEGEDVGEDEDEGNQPPNPNASPQANTPQPNPGANPEGPHGRPAMGNPDPNGPDEPHDPDDEPFAAFLEPTRLRNIYIRAYVPSVFAGATKEDTRRTLENIRLVLEDAAGSGELPDDIQDALPKMARTIRSLRHKGSPIR